MIARHLLVNLFFWIFWFSILEISSFCKILLEHMLVRYRGVNNKGFLGRPWTKWRVLRAISSTLKFEFTVKCWKVDFLMSSKTKSCQSSTECLRMLRALPRDTPRPPQFQPELPKKQFLWKTRFSQFFQFVFCQRWTSNWLSNQTAREHAFFKSFAF